MNDIEKGALWLLCGECDLDEEDYCDGLRIDAAEALRAVVAALTPPDGYVLVPVEPTDAQIDRATWEEVGGHCHSCTAWPASHSDARRVWAAMLAARPGVSP